MDFKNMTDSELASVMVNYIERVNHLKYLIIKYLESYNCNHMEAEQIKCLYRQLKNEVREYAKYLNSFHNRNDSDSKLYKNFFIPSICEASASGFDVFVNHKVDEKMLNSVIMAYYELTGYYSLDEWKGFI